METLDAQGLLPGITFIFSRAGCDAAVRQCLAAGITLTQSHDREEIRRLVEERTIDLPHEDLAILGYSEWVDGLMRGIAAHHAGLIPRFKEVVEELFQQGLVRMVFATETLALGINMPARTVVIGSNAGSERTLGSCLAAGDAEEEEEGAVAPMTGPFRRMSMGERSKRLLAMAVVEWEKCALCVFWCFGLWCGQVCVCV